MERALIEIEPVGNDLIRFENGKTLCRMKMNVK